MALDSRGGKANSSPRMSATAAWACAENRADSDQYQDDACPEQEVATVVLIGVGDVAEERDRPA